MAGRNHPDSAGNTVAEQLFSRITTNSQATTTPFGCSRLIYEIEKHILPPKIRHPSEGFRNEKKLVFDVRNCWLRRMPHGRLRWQR